MIDTRWEEMKTTDLFLKYAQVINMCEGTKVKPWEGVRSPKTKELHRINRHPDFTMPPETYEFMVAVLEDKPVFVGDKVYGKYAKNFYTVSKEMIDSGEHDYSDNDYWSWNPPKKTFMLNGDELPCPIKTPDNPLSSAFLLGGQAYHFSDWDDCLKVQVAIHKLLQDATK